MVTIALKICSIDPELFSSDRVKARTAQEMSKKKMLNEFVGRPGNLHREKSDPNRIIGRKLKALYSAVEEEGIPEKFLTLLEKLDMAERRQTASDESDE